MKALFILMAIGATAFAAGTDRSDLNQSADRQEQIRGDTRQVDTKLQDIVDEYVGNGLATGSDYNAAQNAHTVLGSLTAGEMPQVVGLLKQAASSAAPADPIAKAYGGGKDIAVKLKQLLESHAQRQDIDSISDDAARLLSRQSANLSTAIDARQLAGQDKSANGQTAVSTSLQEQKAEQNAIDDAAKSLTDKLTRVAANSSEPAYKDAAARMQNAEPQTAAAAAALANDKLDDAVNAENLARTQLARIAQELAPGAKPAPGSAEASDQPADIAREQRDLLKQTTTAGAALAHLATTQTPAEADKALAAQVRQQSFAKQLAAEGLSPGSPADQIHASTAAQQFLAARSAQLQQQADALHQQMSGMAATQAALAARAQMAREDLEKNARDAAIPMTNAVTQMNSAQDALAQGDTTEAAQDETDAANQLDQANKLAQQDARNSEQPAPGPQQLQNGVRDLANRETAALQHGDARKTGPAAAAAAAQQEQMAEKAQALQQAAATQNSPVGGALQQAADALQHAAQSMQTGTTPDAAETAQQAALQHLTDAGQQLAQQAADANQEKRDFSDLQRQMNGLQHAIQDQQQLTLDTATAAGSEDARAAAGLARRQDNVQKEADNAAKPSAASTLPPDASQQAESAALDRAGQAMDAAAGKLNDGSPAEAAQPQQAARAALYQAQDALADRMQNLAHDLGQPIDQNLPNLESQLQHADDAAADAQKSLARGSGGMRSAAGQLQQAARETSQPASQPQAMPQSARDAVRAADQDLAQAANAASHSDQATAQSSAAQARQELADAESQLHQMQAGISQLAPPSDEQGQPSQDSSQDLQVVMAGQGTEAAHEKNWRDLPGQVESGAAGTHGASHFLGLPERDRAAVQQSQSEKYPQEYGSMIEEYMRSLSNDSGGK